MSSAKDTREVVLRLQDVDAGYGSTPFLKKINLEIYRGEIVVLLGGSGSGKSTLLKTMTGLLPPIGGTMTLLNQPLYDLDAQRRSQLLQRTGMLFQYGALFGSKTVLENVALPLLQHTDLPRDVVEEMVRMKLALVGLERLEHRLPADISGGQRKRVALARASICDPEIIFADEPSAGLDPIVAAGLDETLRRFQELFGITMIVVTHELESIKALADRVIMLENRKICAVGTVEELTRSEIPFVHNFFHRVAPDYSGKGASIMDLLERSDMTKQSPTK